MVLTFPGSGIILAGYAPMGENGSFFLSGNLYTGVTSSPDDDLARQYPDIRQMRETVGTYELDIRDVEVPLKIRIIRTGDQVPSASQILPCGKRAQRTITVIPGVIRQRKPPCMVQ